jgi:hypothetical protein
MFFVKVLRLNNFINLIKSAGFFVVGFYIVNLIMFMTGVISQEVTFCFKKCMPLASLDEHPVWFSLIMLFHTLILIMGFSAIKTSISQNKPD